MSLFTYESFIRKTELETDTDSLNNTFLEALGGYGFDRAALNLKSDHNEIGLKETVGIFTNIPAEWMEIYHRQNLQNIDPVLMHARVKSTPFKWSDTAREMNLSLKQSDFLKGLEKSNLHDGYFFPLWGHNTMAGVGIARSVPDGDVDEDNINLIAAFSRQYYECFLKLKRKTFLAHQKKKEYTDIQLVVLTAREIEILKLAAKGNKDQEIGDMLLLSRHTVDAHFRNIYKKMSAKSRTEAVASALSDHLIWI